MKKMIKKMAITMVATAGFAVPSLLIWSGMAHAYQDGDGVAISRVTANTRHSLHEHSQSSLAQKLGALINQSGVQYGAWEKDCGGEGYRPQDASPACREKASQMHNLWGKIYNVGAEYLNSIAPVYGKGKREAAAISNSLYTGQSPGELYEMTLNGAGGADSYEFSGENVALDDSPFQVSMDDFSDPGTTLMDALQQLVPELSEDVPEVIRAGVLAAILSSKEGQSRKLANAFERAGNMLASKRDYEAVTLQITENIVQIPKLLGITGVNAGGFTAKADKHVLAWHQKKAVQEQERKKIGGFQPKK